MPVPREEPRGRAVPGGPHSQQEGVCLVWVKGRGDQCPERYSCGKDTEYQKRGVSIGQVKTTNNSTGERIRTVQLLGIQGKNINVLKSENKCHMA